MAVVFVGHYTIHGSTWPWFWHVLILQSWLPQFYSYFTLSSNPFVRIQIIPWNHILLTYLDMFANVAVRGPTCFYYSTTVQLNWSKRDKTGIYWYVWSPRKSIWPRRQRRLHRSTDTQNVQYQPYHIFVGYLALQWVHVSNPKQTIILLTFSSSSYIVGLLLLFFSNNAPKK
jgi:hypothetical protein